MSIVDQLKDVAELIRKMDNIELFQKILDLQTSAMALQEENRELKERVRQLEEKSRVQASLVYRNNLYWKRDETGKEEGPYCPRCWEADGKLVHLRVNGDEGAFCLNCKSGFDRPSGIGVVGMPSPFKDIDEF